MADAHDIISQVENQPDEPQIVTLRERVLKMTVQQIRDLCSANPSHPLAVQLVASVRDFPASFKVGVEKSTLVAIADNGTVAIKSGTDAERGLYIAKSVVPIGS